MTRIEEIYGSAAPFKSGPIDYKGLSDEEVKSRMQVICARYPDERARLRAAYEEMRKVEYRTHLAIKFKQPDILSDEQAKTYLQKALDDKYKITEADAEALIKLEHQEQALEYDLAKFDCDTTDKDFAKLEKLLSYAQSEMKLV